MHLRPYADESYLSIDIIHYADAVGRVKKNRCKSNILHWTRYIFHYFLVSFCHFVFFTLTIYMSYIWLPIFVKTWNRFDNVRERNQARVYGLTYGTDLLPLKKCGQTETSKTRMDFVCFRKDFECNHFSPFSALPIVPAVSIAHICEFVEFTWENENKHSKQI